MATILPTKSIFFNDVVLLPKRGVIQSRKEVPDERFRVITSPMVSVIGKTFVVEAAKNGISLTLPRFITNKEKIEWFNLFEVNKINPRQLCFISIGMYETYDSLTELVLSNSVNWLFDVADGYLPQWRDVVSRFFTFAPIHNLMVGNVVTKDGAYYLKSALEPFCKTLYIRVGIGNGGPCSTSDNTGINRGQITELMECCDGYVQSQDHVMIVSDGGIKNGGYCMKAFGAGADYVLMGGYFTQAIEAETNIKGDGTYFGCASEKQNQLAGLDKHSEGKINPVNTKELKPLSYLVKELWGGISSGISYVGYKSVSEFVGNGIFEKKYNSLPPKIRH